jgi:Tol biopolymer transport system component
VSSAGGNPVAVTALDKARGDIVHRHPKFLPDGRHFVFLLTSTTPGKSGLYLGDVDSRETKRLVASDAMGSFVPPKYLVFMNGTTMMGQEFDLGRLELAGDPFPIADDVGINGANGVAGFTFSENGTLAFRTGGNLQQRVLRWVDRTGKELESVGAVGPHDNVRLAPDGKRIAELRIDAADRGAGDVWIYDLVRATSTRFTFNPAIDNSPVWSPDGRRIVFSSAKAGGIRDLYLKDAAGGGDEELILKSDFSKEPTDWSRDGRFILFTEQKNATDVWVLPLDGDRKPIPLLTTSFFESRARFSPDGRWIAYTSDETGSNQVYIQSFPQRAGKWQVSASGGQEPQWRADGRELFYSGGGAIWAVDVNTAGGTVVAGVPRKLFDGSVSQGSLLTRYAAAPDGSRFLLNVGVAQAANTVPPVRVVVNWTSGLNQR